MVEGFRRENTTNFYLRFYTHWGLYGIYFSRIHQVQSGICVIVVEICKGKVVKLTSGDPNYLV